MDIVNAVRMGNVSVARRNQQRVIVHSLKRDALRLNNVCGDVDLVAIWQVFSSVITVRNNATTDTFLQMQA
jgi:hypothetical protein